MIVCMARTPRTVRANTALVLTIAFGLAATGAGRAQARPRARSSCPAQAPQSLTTHHRRGISSAMVPGHPTSLVACRYLGFNQPQPSGTLAGTAALPATTTAALANSAPVLDPKGSGAPLSRRLRRRDTANPPVPPPTGPLDHGPDVGLLLRHEWHPHRVPCPTSTVDHAHDSPRARLVLNGHRPLPRPGSGNLRSTRVASRKVPP
jgi:hypothetical protein